MIKDGLRDGKHIKRVASNDSSHVMMNVDEITP